MTRKRKDKTEVSPETLAAAAAAARAPEGHELTSAPAAPPSPRKAVEVWRSEKRTPEWAYAAAKTMHSWPEGRVVTEQAFDAAIRAATSVQLSSPSLPTRRKAK